MISQTVEYALRAVAHLASVAPTGQTTDQIAKVTMVPRAYLSKVLQALVRGGVVYSQRGVGGGMTLARPASELTILDVVNAVDPIQRIHVCPLGRVEHAVQLCPLHRRLDNALESVEIAFAGTKLSEVISESSPAAPLCARPKRKTRKKRAVKK